MKLVYKDSDLYRANEKTWGKLQRSRKKYVTTFSDLTFLEINRRRSDGLLKKYVWVFYNGKNITPLVGLFLKSRLSRSEQFCGALTGGGYGLRHADILIDVLEQNDYGYFEKMLLSLVTSGTVRIEI
jgi:hypothetical protein